MKQEEIERVIHKIEQLVKQNPTFGKELQKRFGGTTSALLCNSGNEKINDIYELCIEKIIREQAEQFYKNFPIESIKSQLIEDFIRMERFKRKDNFGDFCLAVYQQIEGIVTKICSDSILNEIVEKMMGYPAYTINGELKNRNKDSTYTIAKLLFLDKAIEKSKYPLSVLYANDKLRCILYFICYKASITSSDYEQFLYRSTLLYYIYQYRNTNHRGGTVDEHQKSVFKKVEPVKYQYYLKFMGELVLFVEGICRNYPLSQDYINYGLSLEKRIIIKKKGLINLKVIGKINLDETNNRKTPKKANHE